MIALRMKQPRFDTFIGVSSYSVSLVPIATWTYETEVLEFRPAAKRRRMDMFDLEGDNR